MDGLIFNWNFPAVRKVSRWSQEDAELSSELMHSLASLLLSLVHMLGNNCHSSSNKLFYSPTSRTYGEVFSFSRKILLYILCFWKVQLWEKSTKCPGVAKLEKLWKCCAGNWNFGPDGWMLCWLGSTKTCKKCQVIGLLVNGASFSFENVSISLTWVLMTSDWLLVQRSANFPDGKVSSLTIHY